MADYTIARFTGQGAVSREDVVAFWLREQAMDAAAAERRSDLVVLVATTAEGELAAVSTAFLQRHARLGMELWNHREFVGAAHRTSALGLQLALRGRDELERRWVELEDRRGSGLLRIDAPTARPEAHWEELGVVFVGFDARGGCERVRYFPGANAPEPPPG